ncbi:ribonuclease P protein subunit [Candidatus Woesearchaeota archaeon]|nr:ribonuclease P protein subunit [Candidatus Woesearchaeota archaeon]
MARMYPRELIGESIKVIQSTNKQLQGLRGTIVDETKSTLVIEHDGKSTVLLKNAITFRLSTSGRILNGKELIRAPHERLKGN